MKIPLAVKIILWIIVPGATLWAGYEAYKYFRAKTQPPKPPYTGPVDRPEDTITRP